MRFARVMSTAKSAFLRLLCLITAVFSVFALTGCHGRKTAKEFEIPDEFDTSRQYEIVFWAKNDNNKTQTEIYRKAIEDFEALYPNIRVNLRLYTDYNKIYNDVITNISTGTTPNVCITYPDHIATYISGDNTVIPLDELLTDPEYGLGGEKVLFDAPVKEEIVPEFLGECEFAGHTYALPFMRSTEALYVNRDYVEALGYELPDVLTWDFIWEVSEKALEKNPDGSYALNGQMVLIPFMYKSTDNMMISMLRQKNAGYSSEEGSVEIFNDTTDDILKTVASHAATGAFSTFSVSGYPGNFLNAGQCIFAVDSTAGATWMGSDAPLIDIHESALKKFTTEVRMIPQFDPGHPSMISQGPSVCVFNKEDPQEVLASWLFTQYLVSNEVQIAYSETEGYVPVTKKAQDSEEYRDYLNREGEDNDLHYEVKIRAARLLMEHTENTFVTPVFNGSTSLRSAAGAMIEEVVKASRRKINVDEAFLHKTYENVTSLYRLGQGNVTGAKQELGPLPSGAKALIITLVIAWALILFVVIRSRLRAPAA